MVDMKFELISAEDFRAFANSSAYRSFMQTPEIANYRESEGWAVYYFAVVEKDIIVAAALAFAKPTFLGKSSYVIPGGPIMDYENRPLVQFFLKNLKLYAKTHNGYEIRISPYYELIERDRNGLKVEEGFDHSEILTTIRNCGFLAVSDASQPKYLFVLDINGRSANELFADFKRNTRNHIRKAERQGVTVRELKRSELSTLKGITESTSKRRNFSDRPLSYYEKMYDLFTPRGEIKYLVAEANINGKNTPLAVAMFMLYGDEIVYLFSGSDEKYMREYNAQYLIQWQIIQYAAEHHFARYNFYGIQGLPDQNSKDYGIYDFKKGFGGHVVELAGTFSARISSLAYLHSLLVNFKKHITKP